MQNLSAVHIDVLNSKLAFLFFTTAVLLKDFLKSLCKLYLLEVWMESNIF